MKGTIITLCGASFWGLCAVVSKYLIGTQGLDAVWMTNFRMLTAGLILLAFAVSRNPRGFMDIWKDRASVGRLMLVAIFGFGICQVTYFIAIDASNAGIATAIQQTAPIWVLAYVLLCERRRPSAKELTILVMVIAGSFLIATGGSLSSLSIPALALVTGLISAVTCAMYTMLPGKLIERYGTFETVGWGLTLGGLMLIPISKLWVVSGTFTAGTYLGLAYIVLIGAVAAFGMFLYGVSLVGPVKGSIYGLIEPVVATFASLIFLGQKFTVAEYLGIAAILVGIAWLAKPAKNSK